MRLALGVVLAASASLIAMPVAAASSARKSPIVLGNLGSYSGQGSDSTVGGKTGIEVWAKWVNAHGGVDGHPIKLVVLDDQGTPATSIADVHKLVQQDHVMAIVAYNGNFEGTWASYVQSQGVPVIGGSLNTTTWTSNPMFFPEGTTVVSLLYGLADVAKIAHLKKYGGMYCSESSACSAAVPVLEQVIKSLGITYVPNVEISESAANYTAPCLTMKDAGAQVLQVAVDTTTLIRIANDCATQGYHPIFTMGDQEITPELKSDPALSGFLGVSGVFPWIDHSTPATRDFQAAMKKYAKSALRSSSDYAVSTAQSWTSGMLFMAAAKAGDLGAHPTRQALLNGLWSLKNDTLGGLAPPLTFQKDAPAPGVNCFFVMSMKKGKFTEPYGLKHFCQPSTTPSKSSS